MSLAIVLTSVVALTLSFYALRTKEERCDFLRQKAGEYAYKENEELSRSERLAVKQAKGYYNRNCR